MRKRPTIGATSEAEFSLTDAKRLISDLHERVLRLEAELFGTGAFLLGPLPVKPEMGRKRKLEPEELLRRRDILTRWVEQDWNLLLRGMELPIQAEMSMAGKRVQA